MLSKIMIDLNGRMEPVIRITTPTRIYEHDDISYKDSHGRMDLVGDIRDKAISKLVAPVYNKKDESYTISSKLFSLNNHPSDFGKGDDISIIEQVSDFEAFAMIMKRLRYKCKGSKFEDNLEIAGRYIHEAFESIDYE